MKFLHFFQKAFRFLLPSPFSIALILTFLTLIFAIAFTLPEGKNGFTYSLDLVGFWENGLWTDGKGGLYFAFQMMLMLVLGHTLALSKPISKLLDGLLKYCKSTASSAFIVTLIAILFSLFNWGLGLIVGAILARKIGEKFAKMNQVLNYGLIGAGAYSGLMVWHGGLSGSAPIKASEVGNIQSMAKPELATLLPESIDASQTIFSPMNITISLALIILIPLLMRWIGKKSKSDAVPHFELNKTETTNTKNEAIGIGKLDYSSLIGIVLGSAILLFACYKAFFAPDELNLKFLNPNFINLCLLGACLLFHFKINSFLSSAGEAIKGTTGILIQFPLYFGIMAIMKNSGLLSMVTDYFVSISSEDSFPILTFFSAGLVNIFVPSGGGQWAVQGPIIIEGAQTVGTSLSKSILALAYGDQLTNMLQPFWALPLLGITGLKAKDILPYTLILFLAGGLIFLVGLIIY